MPTRTPSDRDYNHRELRRQQRRAELDRLRNENVKMEQMLDWTRLQARTSPKTLVEPTLTVPSNLLFMNLMLSGKYRKVCNKYKMIRYLSRKSRQKS